MLKLALSKHTACCNWHAETSSLIVSFSCYCICYLPCTQEWHNRSAYVLPLWVWTPFSFGRHDPKLRPHLEEPEPEHLEVTPKVLTWSLFCVAFESPEGSWCLHITQAAATDHCFVLQSESPSWRLRSAQAAAIDTLKLTRYSTVAHGSFRLFCPLVWLVPLVFWLPCLQDRFPTNDFLDWLWWGYDWLWLMSGASSDDGSSFLERSILTHAYVEFLPCVVRVLVPDAIPVTHIPSNIAVTLMWC